MTVVRILLGVVGTGLLVYGAGRLVLGLPGDVLGVLLLWCAGAVIIVFGLLSPLVVGIGVALRRLVPDRGRSYLHAGLIMAGCVTVVALPLMLRQHTQPAPKAMLLQDYRISLLLLLVIIGVGTAIAYAIRVGRDRPRPDPTS